MSVKLPTIQTFMTPEDEKTFSLILKDHFPQICFIETYVWDDPEPKLCENISEGKIPFSDAALLNTEIFSLDEYRKLYVKQHLSGEGFMCADIGKGLIQFLRSREADYAKHCLRNGRLSASYELPGEPETDAFVKAVWKIFKKGAEKVYFINIETGTIAEKPETKFFAWPDAAKKYNGENGRYLTNHAFAYFIPESAIKR